MKIYEITFTDNKESGIYSVNLIKAESQEQAIAYFKTLGNHEIVGCTESNSSPKPGQPVHTVPDDWEAPEESARTTEEITAEIIEFFKNNDDIFTRCIEELDAYNGYLGDDRYYYMEDLNEFYHDTDPIELLQRAFFGYDTDSWTTDSSGNKEYGAFNPNREYFTYNGYGNLVSADYKDYSTFLDEYTIEEMSENRRYIDTIEGYDELAALFDELEAVGE